MTCPEQRNPGQREQKYGRVLVVRAIRIRCGQFKAVEHAHFGFVGTLLQNGGLGWQTKVRRASVGLTGQVEKEVQGGNETRWREIVPWTQDVGVLSKGWVQDFFDTFLRGCIRWTSI